jgi:hypothetical protein
MVGLPACTVTSIEGVWVACDAAGAQGHAARQRPADPVDGSARVEIVMAACGGAGPRAGCRQ